MNVSPVNDHFLYHKDQRDGFSGGHVSRKYQGGEEGTEDQSDWHNHLSPSFSLKKKKNLILFNFLEWKRQQRKDIKMCKQTTSFTSS